MKKKKLAYPEFKAIPMNFNHSFVNRLSFIYPDSRFEIMYFVYRRMKVAFSFMQMHIFV